MAENQDIMQSGYLGNKMWELKSSDLLFVPLAPGSMYSLLLLLFWPCGMCSYSVEGNRGRATETTVHFLRKKWCGKPWLKGFSSLLGNALGFDFLKHIWGSCSALQGNIYWIREKLRKKKLIETDCGVWFFSFPGECPQDLTPSYILLSHEYSVPLCKVEQLDWVITRNLIPGHKITMVFTQDYRHNPSKWVLSEMSILKVQKLKM